MSTEKVPGDQDALQHHHLLTTRETAEPGVLAPAQPRTSVLLPPLTTQASCLPAPLPEFTSTPRPQLFSCWLVLPPALKIGQLPVCSSKAACLRWPAELIRREGGGASKRLWLLAPPICCPRTPQDLEAASRRGWQAELLSQPSIAPLCSAKAAAAGAPSSGQPA